MTAAIARSQGQRSSSVSGVPLCIFATFAGGCSASPSWYRQPDRSATSRATVVLPAPETPMTTSTTGSSPISPCPSSLRRETAQAAVDGQADAGDLASLVRGEEHRGPRHVPRIALPPHRAHRVTRAHHLLHPDILAGDLR